jgi:hypothetical protein
VSISSSLQRDFCLLVNKARLEDGTLLLMGKSTTHANCPEVRRAYTCTHAHMHTEDERVCVRERERERVRGREGERVRE